MIENWRIWVIVILLILSLADLVLTYKYVKDYKEWQPEKSYSLMENNPLLVFLWNNVGLTLGTITGAIIIWTLLFIIGKSAHPIVIGIVFLFLIYALFNHYTNLGLLKELIIKYPDGVIPKELGK